jgi:nucleotide sugar dehydrogenase
LLCVGTPSRKNGSLDLKYLEKVCEEVGRALSVKNAYHVVVVRSTVLPGTTHSVVIPALERASGKKYGDEFGVSVNPEFLREGTALKDFRKPPLTLVGHNHAADASGTIALYQSIDAPLVSTSIRVAEMMKYTSNTWHALKVVFANEIGNLCKKLDVDSHEVMDIFCRDEKLNLSSYYLKPGFAFGGSCLPKDVRALQYRAKEVDVEMPLISQILPSNKAQIQLALDQVLDTGKKNRRHSRLQLQSRHGRSSREPDRHPGGGAPGQRRFAQDLRQERVDGEAGWSEQGIHRQADPAPVLAAVQLDFRGHRRLRGHRGRQPVARVRRRGQGLRERSHRDRSRPSADLRHAAEGRLPRHLLVGAAIRVNSDACWKSPTVLLSSACSSIQSRSKALQNMLGEIEMLISTTTPLPENRTARASS